MWPSAKIFQLLSVKAELRFGTQEMGKRYEPRGKRFHPRGQGTEESQAGDFPWQAPHPQP